MPSARGAKRKSCEAKIGPDKDIPHVSAPMNITDLKLLGPP